jgi:hypothetical protein
MKSGKIHFVHHLEKSYAPANLGDWISSPYYYFEEFFSRYTCVLHSAWAVLWHEIERDDIVIIGGGGLLDNSDQLNIVLNKLLENCNNVIIWGAGTHKYNKDNIFGNSAPTIKINFNKALLCGIRDYQHAYDLPFVPCVSCLNEAFNVENKKIDSIRQIGTIRSALEESFAVSGIPSSVSNAEPIGTIIKYIMTSKIMLVSSYHGAYWSMLLNRKVILPVSRLGIDKYKYLKYPIAIYKSNSYDENSLLRIASELPDHHGFLQEARDLNIKFFDKVKKCIEERILIPRKSETIEILSKRNAQLEFTLLEVWNHVLIMNERLSIVEGSIQITDKLD